MLNSLIKNHEIYNKQLYLTKINEIILELEKNILHYMKLIKDTEKRKLEMEQKDNIRFKKLALNSKLVNMGKRIGGKSRKYKLTKKTKKRKKTKKTKRQKEKKYYRKK